MENLKKLMGEAYHEGVTIEDVNKFLQGKNYADLSTGNYVDKHKYNDLNNQFNTYKNNTKDYDTLKTENENYKNEKTKSEHLAKLKELGVDDKYAKFVYSEVEKGDKFEENVKKYLKDNPQFNVSNKPVITKIRSNPDINDGKGNVDTENATMNSIFRGAFNNN